MIVPHDQALYCAGCRELIDFNEAQDAWVIMRNGPTSRGWLVRTVHGNKSCPWRLYLNNPHWLDGPLDPRETVMVGEFRGAGFAVEGMGDDRGFARLVSPYRKGAVA